MAGITRGGAWAGRRVASCVLGEGANELAEASIIVTTKGRIMRLSLLVPALLFRSSHSFARWLNLALLILMANGSIPTPACLRNLLVTHCCRNRCFVYVPRVANFAPVFARPGSSQTVGGGLTDEARRVLRALYKNDTARLYERLGAPICEWEACYRRYGL